MTCVKKREVEDCSVLVAFLKQQVVSGETIVLCARSSYRLIGVEMPAVPLKLLDCWTYIFVMTDLHTHPFFQRNLTLREVSG